MSHRRPLFISLLVVGVCLVGTTILGVGVAGAAQDSPPPPFFPPTTCASGPVASGSYVSLTIAGNCTISDPKVVVFGNLVIDNGADLNAATPAQLVVKGNVSVMRNAVFSLGCDQETGCSTPTADRIRGNLTAVDTLAVSIHSSSIFGTTSLLAGGGGVTCSPNSTLGGPAFSDLERNVLSGVVVVDNMRSCWFGFIGNLVGANVNITTNRFADPDANEVVSNTIVGNLNCFNNIPHAQVGDSHGAPNIVTGRKRGECVSL